MLGRLVKFGACLTAMAVLTLGSQQTSARETGGCDGTADCIGMVIDSGDPVLIQMGHELSGMVTGAQDGVVVKPTEGPIRNVLKMLSRENAGLSIVPSDMLLFTSRSEDEQLRRAAERLRFIMTIGRKVAHFVARRDIARLEDLDGKRVALGPDNTASWVVSNNLLHLHGVTPAERLQMKPADALRALLSGQVDAAFVIGDAPVRLIEEMGRGAGDLVRLLEVRVPPTVTAYEPVTVNYPGFDPNLATVAILPTLVSYDFTHRSTPYFQNRCNELGRIGATVRDRLEELRATGHQQWRATSWELKAGDWQMDACFFGTPEAVVASQAPVGVVQTFRLETPDDVRSAQTILTRLGYDPGPVDGILGPMTAMALDAFRTDNGFGPDSERRGAASQWPGQVRQSPSAGCRQPKRRRCSRIIWSGAGSESWGSNYSAAWTAGLGAPRVDVVGVLDARRQRRHVEGRRGCRASRRLRRSLASSAPTYCGAPSDAGRG